MSEHHRSCLDLTEYDFRRLSERRCPLTIDGGALPGALPSRPVTVYDARVVLLKRQTQQWAKDRIWSHVVRLARSDPDPWVLAATGMMIPGMKRISAQHARFYPGDIRDLESDVLEGFLQALRSVDADAPALWVSLYRAAACHARRARRASQRERRQAGHADLPEAISCPHVGNPDLILAKALRDGVLTSCQADLVCQVHLDDAPRCDVARRLGISRHRVSRELTAAARGLSTYLAAA